MSDTENTGKTPSEAYLGKLCRHSFLSLWSHSNPTVDRGRTEKHREGKELCDLLVVSDKNIIIFSDKSCAMTNSGNTQTDWNRWYKRSIRHSAKQIYGAERNLRDFPDRIYADKCCTQRLPVEMPSPSEWKVHRIIVALGAGERCASFYGDNSRGSLVIRPEVRGDEHLTNVPPAGPFVVGQPDLKAGFVHVFDDVNLSLVLGELTTITDFVEYLNAKENFYLSGKMFESHGEEETLATYLMGMDEEHLGSFNDVFSMLEHAAKAGDKERKVVLREDAWDSWLVSDLRKFKLEIEEPSGFWDQIIERIAQAAIKGELTYGSDRTIQNHERNLRFMSSEPRLQRSVMARGMIQKIQTTPSNVRTSIVLQCYNPKIRFVFVLLQKPRGYSQRRYRLLRQKMLEGYAMVVKSMYPEADFVYCLAMESGNLMMQSEDLMSFDFRNWSDKEFETARNLQKEYDILTDTVTRNPLTSSPNTKQFNSSKGNRKERRRAKAEARKT